jgi:hypothetical protein
VRGYRMGWLPAPNAIAINGFLIAYFAANSVDAIEASVTLLSLSTVGQIILSA